MNGESALMINSRSSHIDILRALIEAGADVNLQDINGETALIKASEYGYIDIVNALIKAGADPNLKNIYEETALDIAEREETALRIAQRQNQEEEEEEEYNVYTDIIIALQNYINELYANTNDSDSGESYYYDGMIISEKMSPRRC
jgi:hypothetical protein